MLQKFAGPLVGPLFVGAPVQPNMLNMPKSASVSVTNLRLLTIRDGQRGVCCEKAEEFG